MILETSAEVGGVAAARTARASTHSGSSLDLRWKLEDREA